MSYYGSQLPVAELVELSVVGCRNLANKEFITKQDPYVIVEYGSHKFRTRTARDGGISPAFNEKFTIHVQSGSTEVKFNVWNDNMLVDDFIGSARMYLGDRLATGFDDCWLTLYSNRAKPVGDIRVIASCPNLISGQSRAHGPYNTAHPPVTSYTPTHSYVSPPPAYVGHQGSFSNAQPQGWGGNPPPPAPYTTMPPPPPPVYPQTYYANVNPPPQPQYSNQYPPQGGYPPQQNTGYSAYPPQGGYAPATGQGYYRP